MISTRKLNSDIKDGYILYRSPTQLAGRDMEIHETWRTCGEALLVIKYDAIKYRIAENNSRTY